MRGAITACLLLGGCDVIFTLKEPGFDPPATPTVTGTTLVRNAELVAGVPTTFDTPGEDVQVQVRFENGERINVAVQPDGSFEFVRPTNEYAIEYTFDSVVRELQENAAEIRIVIRFAGRSDATQVTDQTVMQFPDAGTATGYVATVGQWTLTALDATSPKFDWRDAATLGNRDVGLFSSTRGDQLFYLQFADGAFVGGQTAILGVAQAAPFEMSNGNPVNLTGLVPTPTSETGCVRLTSDLEGAAARFEQIIASDPTYLPRQRGWGVSAAPSPMTIGTAGGINLANGVFESLEFEDVDVPYHDPFANHEVLVTIGISSSRPVTVGSGNILAGAGAAFLFEGPAPGACAESPLRMTGNVPFPTDIQIDGEPMADGQPVPTGRELRVTWTTESNAFDFFDIPLVELTDVAGKVESKVLRTFRTRRPQITIPDDLLVAGHHYVLPIASIVGFPDAAVGNYETIVFPVASALITSALFEAQ